MEKDKSNNIMREVKLEKVVLSIGGTGDNLEKGFKLLQILTNKKPAKMKSRKRIPSLGVRPDLEVGVVSTVRKDVDKFLRRMLGAVYNKLKRKQVKENHFSFGIKEYIEIPDMEYQREVGMRGLDVTVVFKRAGRRVRLKKTGRGKIPERQRVTKEEIIKYMEEKFKTEFTGK